MNTLLVVPWDHTRGGVISVVANLASHLEAAGHRVLFFHNDRGLVLKRGVTKLGFAGVRLRLSLPSGPGLRGVLRTLASPVLFTSSLLQLIWLLRAHRIHIVNVHYPIDNFVYFAICRRLLPIRLVLSVHGRDAFYQERPKTNYSWAFKLLMQAADLVILPSDSYRRKLLEAFPEAEDKTIFIHNGIDRSLFRPADPQQRALDGNRYILCVAELQEYKAIDVLLHAAQPLLADDRSLTLVLAGDGPLRLELESLASSVGIRHQTMFLGSQGASEIVQLLQGCELMVLPSRMEPFGLVLIEAMACRKPVVATAVGGIPEIVEHGVSGILVEADNPAAMTEALRRVLTDSALRSRIAANGYARMVERFCSTHNGDAYIRAFTSILPLHQPAPQPAADSSASGR